MEIYYLIVPGILGKIIHAFIVEHQKIYMIETKDLRHMHMNLFIVMNTGVLRI